MKAKKISPDDMKLYVLSFRTSNDLTFGACFLFACFPSFFFFFGLLVSSFLQGFPGSSFPCVLLSCFFVCPLVGLVFRLT